MAGWSGELGDLDHGRSLEQLSPAGGCDDGSPEGSRVQRWLRIVLVIAEAVDRRADPLIAPPVRLLGALTGWGSRRLAWRLWLGSVAATGGWLAARSLEHGPTAAVVLHAGLQIAVIWSTLQLMGLSLAAPTDRRSVAAPVLRLIGASALAIGVVGVLLDPGTSSALYLARGLFFVAAAWAATTELPEERVRIGRLRPATVVVRRRR
ncbi:MAG: hypothetical protein AAGA99_17175 [Actinomycetota bacterium]